METQPMETQPKTQPRPPQTPPKPPKKELVAGDRMVIYDEMYKVLAVRPNGKVTLRKE